VCVRVYVYVCVCVVCVCLSEGVLVAVTTMTRFFVGADPASLRIKCRTAGTI
jgi:hypothetical protein